MKGTERHRLRSSACLAAHTQMRVAGAEELVPNYLLTLATFVSSFFVSQAYPFWTRTMIGNTAFTNSCCHALSASLLRCAAQSWR